jgi:glycosyltransferase involved in cell wall biosynthesis
MTIKQSLISCIIAVYNGERYLRETLDSILAQTYRPLEIIVADDGSIDGTARVAADYGDRITYVRQSQKGYAVAKNLGLSAARGDFVAFLDADDLWHSEKLARQMVRLRERPEIDLCFTRYKNFWMPDLAEEEQRCAGRFYSQPQSAWSICTLLTRRAVFERFGDFHDGTRGLENMTWFLRAAAQGAVIEVLPDSLMYRRFHLGSVTRSNPSEFYQNYFLPILKEWRDYRRQTGWYADDKEPGGV